MTDNIEPPTPAPKPFDEFLREFRRGSLLDEVSRGLHEVLGEVIATEKPGTVTLTVKVVPVGDLQVAIAGEVTTRLPKPAAPAAHFYVDHDGNPSRQDPYQQRLSVGPEPVLIPDPDQEV